MLYGTTVDTFTSVESKANVSPSVQTTLTRVEVAYLNQYENVIDEISHRHFSPVDRCHVLDAILALVSL